MELNLGWGNSRAVRQAFLDTYGGELIVFSHNTLMDFDYPNYDGDHELLEYTKKIIKRQTGQDYKYVFLTNGATGALNTVLRSYKRMCYDKCYTRKAPYYLKYPAIIRNNGFTHVDEQSSYVNDGTSVVLLDLPSNPLSLTTSIKIEPYNNHTIIDGVYLNNVYLRNTPIVPKHDVMIGSYSKLCGLNGARVGWVATNKAILAADLQYLITSEYCGLSSSCSIILNQMLRNLDWEQFEFRAKMSLNHNRESLSKLEKFFGDTPVPEDGMFYYFPIDRKARNLLSKSNVIWTSGKDLGTSDDFARLNVGASNDVIEQAVKTILKEDKI